MADRNARKLGLPPSQLHDIPPRRDPMAERAARRAGIPASRPDFDVTDRLPPRPDRPPTGEKRALTSPTTTKPPTLRKPIAGAGTSLARPSKSHRPPGGGDDDER